MCFYCARAALLSSPYPGRVDGMPGGVSDLFSCLKKIKNHDTSGIRVLVRRCPVRGYASFERIGASELNSMVGCDAVITRHTKGGLQDSQILLANV